jgi:uncharacterized protein YndB with AHSA1/START domain
MTTIRAKALSTATPEVLFDYRTDPARIPEWNATYPALEGATGVPGQAGSTYTLRRLKGRPLEVRVLDSERPSRLVTVARQSGITLLQTTTFTAVEGGTLVESTYEYVVPWSRGGSLTDRFLRRHIEAGLLSSTARLAEMAIATAGA